MPSPAPPPPPTVAPQPTQAAAKARMPGWAWGAIAVVVVLLGVAVLAATGVLGGLLKSGGPATQVAAGPATAAPTSPTPEMRTGDRARQLAEAGVTSNADWIAYSEMISGVEMALVPAGCFQMGSSDGEDNEQPVHQVCFDRPFWIDVAEVTNQQFGSVGCPEFSSEPNQPRNCVGLAETAARCEARGARLPTEAEWEYVARGPDGLAYPWGNDFVADNLVYSGNSDNRTWAVGSKPGGMSWIGAYDLSGNLWELVADWYSPYTSEKVVNPIGPETGMSRVLRGGAWNFDASGARAARRFGIYLYAGGGRDDYGFRCALSYSQ